MGKFTVSAEPTATDTSSACAGITRVLCNIVFRQGQRWHLVLDKGGQHAAGAAALGAHPTSLNLTPLPVGIPRVEIACPVGTGAHTEGRSPSASAATMAMIPAAR